MRVLELEACWAEIVGTVRWIDDCQQPDMYLRQVDVPGVDTKFIEQHRGVLGDLLELQLAAERINLDAPRSDFTGGIGSARNRSTCGSDCSAAVGSSSGTASSASFPCARMSSLPPRQESRPSTWSK